MMAVLLLAIAIAPMVSAFAPALLSTGGEEEMVVFTNRARGTLYRVAALDFKNLDDLVKNNQAKPVDLASLFGDTEETFPFQGKDYTPLVTITGYDADGDDDIDADDEGMLELTVEIGYVSLKTLKAEY